MCRSGLIDGHRHALAKYSNASAQGASVDVDELTHVAYWKHIDFEDPCRQEDIDNFMLCGAQCGSLVHDGQTDAQGAVFFSFPPCSWPSKLPPRIGI